MPIYNALNGSQSYSRAFKLFGQMQALEHAEQLICILHFKACAVVSNEDFHLFIVSLGTANLDLRSCSYARKFHRI